MHILHSKPKAKAKPKQSHADRDAIKAKKTRIKDKWENNNMGDFQNLYPLRKGINQEDDKR